MRTGTRLARLDDERLATLVGRGDTAAFEALYDRHHAALLAFCRHLVGDRQDGEDALQQAFLRAHRALTDGRVPDRVKPWLFAIARNRCLTLLAARRDAAVPSDELEPSFDGLSSDVERRADLRELVSEIARLPDDQRGALVLAELGDFSHDEIGRVIGCPAAKVKALVFQARTTLVADRDARRTPCEEIRTLLETARGGVLRRGALRRHLRQCDPCATYRVAMEGRRSGLALVLPVAPSAGLKAAVLGGAGGLGGGAESAAAAAALVGPGALGAASGGGAVAAGGGAAAAGGGAVAALVTKAAVAVAIGAGAAGGAVAIHDEGPDRRTPPVTIERAADRPQADRPAAATAVEDVPGQPVSDTLPGAAAADSTAQTHERPRRRRLGALLRLASDSPAARRRIRRLAATSPAARRRILRLAATSPAARRRILRLAATSPAARRRILQLAATSPAARRRILQLAASSPAARRRILQLAATSPAARERIRRLAAGSPAAGDRIRQLVKRSHQSAGAGVSDGATGPLSRRRRQPDAQSAPVPAATATPTPSATPEPVASPPPHRRRRDRPAATATPAPTAEPAPVIEATPVPEPTATPTATATPEP